MARDMFYPPENGNSLPTFCQQCYTYGHYSSGCPDLSIAERDQQDRADDAPEMVETCGCGENTGRPVDLDGDGIAEWCSLCGQYYTLGVK